MSTSQSDRSSTTQPLEESPAPSVFVTTQWSKVLAAGRSDTTRARTALASDSQLTGQTGMKFAGADLTTPGGSYFFVSASLRPGSNFDEVRKAMLAHVARLASDAGDLSQAALIGRQLSSSLTEVPSREMIKTQAPPGMTEAMIEGNVGLQLGMHEHRYGVQRLVLAKPLASVTAGKVQQAVRAYLAQEKLSVCTLAPAKN